MKYFISVLLMCVAMFGESGFNKEIEAKNVELKTIIKGTHKESILSFDFYKTEKLLSTSTNEVKVWDIKEQELLKSIVANSVKKAVFSNDGTKIYILDENKFSIFDAVNYKSLNSINGKNLKNFVISNDNANMILLSDYEIKTYELTDGKLINNYKNDSYINHISLSPNEKYFAISSGNHVKIFNAKTNTFISELPETQGIQKIEFVDNNHILIIKDSHGHSQGYIYNTKTSALKYQTAAYDYYARIKSMHNTDTEYLYLLAQNNNAKVGLFDFKTNTIKKYAHIDSSDVTFYGLKLSNDMSMLVVGLNDGNFKLYTTQDFIDSIKIEEKVVPIIISPAKQIVVPEVSVKPIETPKVVTKPIEIPKEIVKPQPTLQLEASVLDGIVPLKVDFSIITTNNSLIESHYINLAGKESMSKGLPPMTLSKTFTQPGSYKVMVVLKDIRGEIITKSVTITTREQTFSDYKNMFK